MSKNMIAVNLIMRTLNRMSWISSSNLESEYISRSSQHASVSSNCALLCAIPELAQEESQVISEDGPGQIPISLFVPSQARSQRIY